MIKTYDVICVRYEEFYNDVIDVICVRYEEFYNPLNSFSSPISMISNILSNIVPIFVIVFITFTVVFWINDLYLPGYTLSNQVMLMLGDHYLLANFTYLLISLYGFIILYEVNLICYILYLFSIVYFFMGLYFLYDVYTYGTYTISPSSTNVPALNNVYFILYFVFYKFLCYGHNTLGLNMAVNILLSAALVSIVLACTGISPAILYINFIVIRLISGNIPMLIFMSNDELLWSYINNSSITIEQTSCF